MMSFPVPDYDYLKPALRKALFANDQEHLRQLLYSIIPWDMEHERPSFSEEPFRFFLGLLSDPAFFSVAAAQIVLTYLYTYCVDMSTSQKAELAAAVGKIYSKFHDGPTIFAAVEVISKGISGNIGLQTLLRLRNNTDETGQAYLARGFANIVEFAEDAGVVEQASRELKVMLTDSSVRVHMAAAEVLQRLSDNVK